MSDLNRHLLVRMIMLAVGDGPMDMFMVMRVITAVAMNMFLFVPVLMFAIGPVNMRRLVLVMTVRTMNVFLFVLVSMFAIGPVNVVALVIVIMVMTMVMTAARAVFVLIVSHLLLPSGQ